MTLLAPLCLIVSTIMAVPPRYWIGRALGRPA